MSKKDKSYKQLFKMSNDELQEYLQFQRKGSVIENKKGKGSYNRRKFKKIENDY